MGGMGQPGGIPGGGIAGLAPQMGGQMGGFGQMVNQAVSQPGMAAPGGGFSPMTTMGGFMGGNPAMPAPGGMPPQTGVGGQMLDQAALQALMQAQMRQDGMGGRPPGVQRPIDPMTGAPMGALVSQPPSMFGNRGGQPGGLVSSNEFGQTVNVTQPPRKTPGIPPGGKPGNIRPGGQNPRGIPMGIPMGLASMFMGRR